MANKYSEHHPDPDAKLWTIKLNEELDQTPASVKEFLTTQSIVGENSKGYLIFNKAGDIIAIQVDHEPQIEAPIPTMDHRTGFMLNFKIPAQFGLFPPFKTMVGLLSDK